MKVTVNIDTTYLKKLFSELQSTVPTTFPQILRGEAAAIAKTCLNWSPIAKKGRVESESYRAATSHDVSINATNKRGRTKQRGVVWFTPDGNPGRGAKWLSVGVVSPYGTFNLARGSGAGDFHLNAKDWGAFQSAFSGAQMFFQKTLKGNIESVGLTKASWLQVIKSLGFSESQACEISPKKRIPQQVLSSKYANLGVAKFGSSVEFKDGKSYAIEIRNSSIIAVKTDRGKLERAVKSRSSAFYIAVKSGVFKKISDVSSRYPFVTWRE